MTSHEAAVDDGPYQLEIAGLAIPIPEWIGDWAQEILDVARGTRWTIFGAGVLAGLLIAMAAFLFGLYLAYT